MTTIIEKLISQIKSAITKIKTNVKIQSIPFDTEYLEIIPMEAGVVTPNLEKSTIILCGQEKIFLLISNFLSKFKSSTFIVDPTPRAVFHVKEA